MKPKLIAPFYQAPTPDLTGGFGYVGGSEQYAGGNELSFFVYTVKTGERRRASLRMRILRLVAVMRDEVLVTAGLKGKAYSRHYRSRSPRCPSCHSRDASLERQIRD